MHLDLTVLLKKEKWNFRYLGKKDILLQKKRTFSPTISKRVFLWIFMFFTLRSFTNHLIVVPLKLPFYSLPFICNNCDTMIININTILHEKSHEKITWIKTVKRITEIVHDANIFFAFTIWNISDEYLRFVELNNLFYLIILKFLHIVHNFKNMENIF